MDEGQWADFLTSGTESGFSPRRDDAPAFARENRVLLVLHRKSGIDIDIVFGSLPFEKEAVVRATWMEWARSEYPHLFQKA